MILQNISLSFVNKIYGLLVGLGRNCSNCNLQTSKAPLNRGVHPPEVMMHFPTVSDFLSISENFSDSMENFSNLTLFRKKCFGFHPPKYLMTIFLVIDSTFRISPPLFAQTVHFPLFWKNYYSPTLNFPSDFFKFMHFLHTFCFSFPP